MVGGGLARGDPHSLGQPLYGIFMFERIAIELVESLDEDPPAVVGGQRRGTQRHQPVLCGAFEPGDGDFEGSVVIIAKLGDALQPDHDVSGSIEGRRGDEGLLK